MPYATQLHLVPPLEARPCRKCGRTDVEFRRAHKRDYICVECNNDQIRDWDEAHPEQVRKNGRSRNARLRAANPAWAMWAAAKQRAKRCGIPFNLQVKDIIIPPCCPVLGIPLQRGDLPGGHDASPSLDRIVPEKGYVVGNIAVISKRANNIKNNATIEELDRVAAWLRATLGR